MFDITYNYSHITDDLHTFPNCPSAISQNSRLDEETEACLLKKRNAACKRSFMKFKSSSNKRAQICTIPCTTLGSLGSQLVLNSNVSDVKRLRPEFNSSAYSSTAKCCTSLEFSRRRNYSSSSSQENFKINTPMICELSLLQDLRLQHFLRLESHYHPKNAFLFYVDPVVEEKVDANLRNIVVRNLHLIHETFFTLSTETLCKAIHLIDRFIVKVKVKPKYVACVAVASYHIAATLVEENAALLPNLHALIQITNCGGNVDDLLRMKNIIASKLDNDLDSVNAFDFLQLFAETSMMLEESEDTTLKCDDTLGQLSSITENRGHKKLDLNFFFEREKYPYNSIPKSALYHSSVCPTSETMLAFLNVITNRLIIALCSVESYRYRSVTLALGILHNFGALGIERLAKICNVSLDEVLECSLYIEDLYNVFSRSSHPFHRRHVFFPRRSLFCSGHSSPTTLDTISEVSETVKDE